MFIRKFKRTLLGDEKANKKPTVEWRSKELSEAGSANQQTPFLHLATSSESVIGLISNFWNFRNRAYG